jgi:transcriptional regulator with XRE-family HTH domain
VNINSSLTKELRTKEYRDGYVASQIRIGLPFQIRGLRKERNLSQGELANKSGMAQPRISEMEKPGERSLNIETLLRVASALDVALEIRFVPFSELVDRSEQFDPDNFHVPSFEAELAIQEKKAPAVPHESLSTTTPTLKQLMGGAVAAQLFSPNQSMSLLLPLSVLQRTYTPKELMALGLGSVSTSMRSMAEWAPEPPQPKAENKRPRNTRKVVTMPRRPIWDQPAFRAS